MFDLGIKCLTYDVRVKELELDPLTLEHRNKERSTSYVWVCIQCFLIKRFIAEVPLNLRDLSDYRIYLI